MILNRPVTLEHPNLDEEICERQILGKTDYDLSPAFLADEFRLDDEYALAGNRVVNRIERVGELGASVGAGDFRHGDEGRGEA